MRPTSGLTFGGRYQLANRIAIGGMGEVWQATDLVIGRTVAIKILKDEYLGDPSFLERFRAEARHAALVNHEGIANIFDYGEEDGSAYLVMELVPGEALSTILERERVLSTDRVLDIVAQTASALHAAHAAGLVHRDIKPGNLLIAPDGRVKITDFGIARIADQVPLTATGQVMGTVQYLSPEQASGHSASPTTDIYSLGIVAYEALAGRRPFTGESQVAIAMAQINDKAPDLPVTVSEPVRNLVYACIAKNPADRPQSAAHIARAAQALRRGDVAGAAAAVPGVRDSALEVTGGPDTSMATRVIPSAASAAEGSGGVPAAKSRNPWTWPLVALIGILLVVLVGTLIALIANPSDGGAEPSKSSTPSETVSRTPSPAVTPTVSVVPLKEGDLIGKSAAEAKGFVEALGLVADVRLDQGVPDTPEKANKVFSAAPTGNVPKGTTVVIKVYGEFPTPSKPGDLTAPAGPYLAEANVNVDLPTYVGCPTGTTLTGFTLSPSAGSTVIGGNSLSASSTGFVWELSATSGASNTISYTATCSGVASPASNTLTITGN
ncbi:hypothetical protein BH09ACT3_BH09ACT3_03570 [soil metagenome]